MNRKVTLLMVLTFLIGSFSNAQIRKNSTPESNVIMVPTERVAKRPVQNLNSFLDTSTKTMIYSEDFSAGWGDQ